MPAAVMNTFAGLMSASGARTLHTARRLGTGQALGEHCTLQQGWVVGEHCTLQQGWAVGKHCTLQQGWAVGRSADC